MALTLKKSTNEKPVKSILVSQPRPENEKSSYHDLAKKYDIKIEFRPFIHVEGVAGKDFKRGKISILEHSAVIFTSRNAIDHFYRVCKEIRVDIPANMKYFCISEAIALYLQKYIQYKKRKVFFGKQTSAELLEVISEHNDEKFLFPCSDIHKRDIPDFLAQNNFDYQEAIFYKTVCSDLSDIVNFNYDMIAFFSPSGIKSLFKNFPSFKQTATRIAAFGTTTHKAVLEAGLRLDVRAPMPQAPSMTMAIDQYLNKANK